MPALFRRSWIVILLSSVTISADLFSKPVPAPEPQTSSELIWSLQKLNTLGRVLYVAAHPDDENTSLISYLSLGRKYDTAYLSLTRGDGGQNLIGPELRDQLGLIRTQELLEARKIDGGHQFFSRARDFGYSKNPEETFRIWNREEVLSDTVWVIRNFRPDVIITRFNPEPSSTHGHHTASAMLAVEAFEAAADKTRFVDQLEFVETWQAKRIVWNTSSWFFRNNNVQFDETEYVEMEVGDYDPLLGRSYNEIASASRSMHRSQGFGTSLSRGARTEYFKLLDGAPFSNDLFDGIETSWKRIDNSHTIQQKLSQTIDSFDPTQPANSVTDLLAVRSELAALTNSDWKDAKLTELDHLILATMGLDARILSRTPYVKNGDTLGLELEIINRSQVSSVVKSVELPFAGVGENPNRKLPYNKQEGIGIQISIPSDLEFPQPYWLEAEGTLGMFDVSNQSLIGKPENDPSMFAVVELEVSGQSLSLKLPLVFRDVDPAKGEDIFPVSNLPDASVSFNAPVNLFPNYESRSIEVKVSALLSDASGTLELILPKGWSSEPKSQNVDTVPQGGERSFSFVVTPPDVSEEVSLQARLTTSGGAFEHSVERINYEHIKEQMLFSSAASRGISLEVATAGSKIGYLMGAGDSVPDSIREMGFELIEIPTNPFDSSILQGLDTVVVGIRAYNTIDGIDGIMDELFGFAESGGTVVVQYNTSRGLKASRYAPYPISLSRDRVTDENAEIRVLAPSHPVMTKPNEISQRDFEGWTQERGLYFPDSWDAAFVPVFGINDPGEPSRDGSLLVAEHGEGYFVYTGISWFRQLPAGVPGAYRIFANLLSLGHTE